MNKILNWTVGSFFRTIGRTIAFLVMGGLIYFILSSNGIDFGIKNLFFDKVDALTLTSEVEKIGDTWWEPTNSIYEAEQSFFTWTVGKGSNIQEFSITSRTNGNPIQTANADYIEFAMILGIPQDITITNQEQIDYDYCHRWNCTTFASNGSCQVFTCNQLYTNTDTTTHYSEYQYTFDNTQMWIRVYYEGGGWNSCSINEGQVTCPTNNKNIDRFTVQILFNPTRSSSIKLGIGKGINLYKKINIQGAIESQTQQQQQQHEEVMDSNTTQAESDAQDFFEGFSVDLGGLTGIITAPLNTIQSLLNSSCTNLVLPLPFVNKNLTLPCMNDIYTTHFGLFFSLYQTIILGIIAYRCIMSIFFDIKGFTNPDDDRIEVMDL